MTDTQVGELLERATADLRPSADLVADGVAAGRRRRRRGFALTAAGTFAAVAVVGGVVALVPGSGSPSDHAVAADPSGSTSPGSFRAEPSASPVTHAPGVNEGPFPVAPGAMASTLATLLHGTVTNPKDDQYHLSGADGWQSGGVDLNGGSVSVSYEHSTGPRCDGDLTRGNTGCTALGDGFFLSSYSAEITTKGEGRTGARDVGVTYYTPDGYKINATASNAGSADPAHPAMDRPVLDLDALTTIAQAPAWR
jgi:hypothetical protein